MAISGQNRITQRPIMYETRRKLSLCNGLRTTCAYTSPENCFMPIAQRKVRAELPCFSFIRWLTKRFAHFPEQRRGHIYDKGIAYESEKWTFGEKKAHGRNP